jgi:hypothetical protein
MPTKKTHLERNILLHEVGRLLLDQAAQLPACRGVVDGRSSFLFLPPDAAGRTVRRIAGRWERIELSKIVLINIGSRVHDDVGGGDGTVLGIDADREMRPLLRVRMDAGGERLLNADATHGV